jgi:hypothetical protein
MPNTASVIRWNRWNAALKRIGHQMNEGQEDAERANEARQIKADKLA